VLLQSGLSATVRACEESRMIFGRMKSHAIFHIAETIRVILSNDLSRSYVRAAFLVSSNPILETIGACDGYRDPGCAHRTYGLFMEPFGWKYAAYVLQ
jgi:hypothetical protein